MRTLTIVKEHNEVMDVCIAYGLLSILNENGVKSKLRNFPNAYIIEAEDYDAKDFVLFKQPYDEKVSFNSMVSNTDRKGLLNKLFGTDDIPGVLEENGAMSIIFSYFETLDERILSENKIKNTKMTYIGSGFDTKGKRSYGNPITRSVPILIRYLASLGYLRTSSYLRVNKDDEFTWVPIPSRKGAEYAYPIDFGFYADKETGEIVRTTFIRENSVLTALSRILLNVQQKLFIDSMLEEYAGIITLSTFAAGNRGLNGKIERFDWLPINQKTTETLRLKMQGRKDDKEYDMKYALASLTVYRSREDFYRYAHILSKENKTLEADDLEEITNMVGLKYLYANEGIQKIGQRLSELISKKRGYEVQVQLMNATEKHEVMRAVSQLSLIYKSKQGYSIWNEEEQTSFLIVLDKEEFNGRDIAAAILLASNTYRNVKKIEETVAKTRKEETVGM